MKNGRSLPPTVQNKPPNGGPTETSMPSILIRHKPFNNIMLYVSLLLQILVIWAECSTRTGLQILSFCSVSTRTIIFFYHHLICLKNVRRIIGFLHVTSHAQNSPPSLDCKKSFQTTDTFRLFSKGIFFFFVALEICS